MKKEGIILVLFLIILMPLALSLDINIKTMSNHKIDLILREAGKLISKDSFVNKDTGEGEVLLTSSADISEVDLIVNLKKDGKIILNKKFESITTNNPININFYPDGEIGIVDDFEKEKEINTIPEEEITENPAENLSEKVVEEESAESIKKENIGESKILGALISNTKDVFVSKTTYYIIGGIFILGVLVFIVFIARKKISNRGDNFKVRKLSDSGYDQRLLNAEKNLDSARKELDDLKNREKRLMEARERFKRDEEELKKIESEKY